jgi:rhodanese-related sulfurtransferase
MSVPAEEMAEQMKASQCAVFDVRKPGEWQAGHIAGAHHTPLSQLNEHLAEFPKEDPYFIHCAGGYRSVIAASILKSRGYHTMIDVAGGFGAIKQTNISLSAAEEQNS